VKAAEQSSEIVPASFNALKWARVVGASTFKNPKTQHLAYLHLAHADAESATCRPTVEQLAERVGLRPRQTKNLRAELCEMGLLELVRKGRHRGDASVYRLTFPHARSVQAGPSEAGNAAAAEAGNGGGSLPTNSNSYKAQGQRRLRGDTPRDSEVEGGRAQAPPSIAQSVDAT
jgi:hypothetical protein